MQVISFRTRAMSFAVGVTAPNKNKETRMISSVSVFGRKRSSVKFVVKVLFPKLIIILFIVLFQGRSHNSFE